MEPGGAVRVTQVERLRAWVLREILRDVEKTWARSLFRVMTVAMNDTLIEM